MTTGFTSNSSGTGSLQPLRRRLLFGVASSAALAACGEGSDATAPSPAPTPPPPPSSSVWAAIDAAIDKAAPSFGNGLTVEVAIPAGVVYSRSSGGYTSQTRNPIASATKWVTGSTILRLVQQGALTLATRTGDLLVDRNGAPWSGPIGQITLSDLLSFTSGLEGDVDEATATSITLAEAVLRIHDSQSK
ncbi:MAG: serine hydrolase, partial [Burkholderiales bacterium]